MSNTIIKTKINIPTLKRDRVARTRITNVLSNGIQQGRTVAIISAPAGFGKTTLVRDWIEFSKIPAAWISLDESDGEPIRFLTYLIAALQTVISGVGDGVLAALQTSQHIPPKQLLTTLLNELASNEEDLTLVLDDYHTIDSNAVDELLVFFVEHLPSSVHLIITTREDPALPLARLRARNQLTEIRAAELRFTENEATDFLNNMMGLRLSTEEVIALEKRTEGWVAGLQLAALSMQGKADTGEFIRSFSGANQFVLDYLLEEVLKKQPDALQSFLFRTSILNRLNASLCDDLLQNEKTSAQEMLERLERENLFVIALDDERRWYRYHHLFRDLLRQRLSQKFGGDEIAKLHINACMWFEREGEAGEAFHHAIAAADFERAAMLLETSWLAMDETFQTGAWLGWANQLPLSVRRLRPVLLTQMGWSYSDVGNAMLSESILQEAEACLKHPREELVVVEAEQFRTLPARIAMAHAYNAQIEERFEDTFKFAEMVQELAPANDAFMQAQAMAILSGAYWASGQLDNSFAFMSGWADAAQEQGNFAFAIGALFAKADILIDQGHLRDAIRVYESALNLAAAHNAEQHTAHHHLGLGLILREMGEDEAAAEHLRKALEIGKHTTIVDWAYRKSLAQAQLKEAEGNYDSALALLDEAQHYYVRSPIPNLRPIKAIKARVYLKQNRLDKAQAWASQGKLSLEDQSNYLHEFEQLTLARIALAEFQHNGNHQKILKAVNMLSAQLSLAQSQKRLRSQIEILVLQALIHHALGEHSQAMSALNQALKLAEPEGYARLFLDEGESMRLLIADLQLTIERSAQTLSGYVKNLLASFPAIHHSTLNLQPLIEPLSERELEVLRLIAQGLSNNEITQKLVVALSTVKGHNLRIFAKLQAKSRTEAVARARELGLL